MSNQNTILYLQVILLAPLAQGLLEVLGNPRIEVNIISSKLLLEEL